MFQTEQRIRERASVGALPRFEYLQALVTEFQDAASTPAAQRQVLASLANFAYDPVNFGHLHALNVAELFLDMCSDASEDCVLLAVRGVCNCCPDERLRASIVENDGVQTLVACVGHANPDVCSVAMAALFMMKHCDPSIELPAHSLRRLLERQAARPERTVANAAQVLLPLLDSELAPQSNGDGGGGDDSV